MNLLTETEEVLENHKLKPGDVNWVGSRDGKYSVSWAVFRKLANKEYNEGYGGAKVVMDLVVVGDGWWMERHEYDGSEWWEFKQAPVRKEDAAPFKSVFPTDYESTIEEMVEGNYGQRN